MPEVTKRTPEQVIKLLEAIAQDVEQVRAQPSTTFDEWNHQLTQIDAWTAVALQDVADILPARARALILQISGARDEVLYQNSAVLQL